MLQNHKDEMRVDEVKPVVFFLFSFAGHKYVSAYYNFLRLWLLERDVQLENCAIHGHSHPNYSGYMRKL